MRMKPINQQYITLHCQGRSYPIQSLKAQESLNAPMWAQVEVDPLPGVAPKSLPGLSMSICLPGGDGGQRYLHGEVSSARTSDAVWTLTLHSRLWQGHLLQKSRLFPDLNRRQLVQQLLTEIGYARDQIDWRVDQPNHQALPPSPLLQAAETHLDCFNRLLSEAGWNYWFEDQGATQERLVISDRDYFQELDLPAFLLPSSPDGPTAINRLSALTYQTSLAPTQPQFSCRLRGEDHQAIGHGHWQTFAPPLSPDAAQRRVTQYQRRYLQHRTEHQLVTHQPRLAAGQQLSLDFRYPPPVGHPPLRNSLLLLSVEHWGHQPHQDQPGRLEYHNIAHAVDPQSAPL